MVEYYNIFTKKNVKVNYLQLIFIEVRNFNNTLLTSIKK